VYFSNIITTNVSAGLLNVYGTMNTGSLFALEMDNAVQPVPYPTSRTLTYGSPWDNFGNAVAVSSDGSTMLTGGNQTNFYGALAFVYRFSSGSWVGPELFQPDYLAGSGFGFSVALSSDGNIALIGDPDFGWANFFRYSGGTWTMDVKIGGIPSYGWSVALSGDGNTAAIGVPFSDIAGDGSVQIFKYSGGNWVFATNLTPAAPVQGKYSYFGYSVALSGDGNTMIVGTGNASSLSTTGAFIYRWDGFYWNTINFVSGPASLTSVSLSYDGGNYAVGFPDDTVNNGSVQVAYYGGFFPSPLGAGTRFGASVSLSSDGTKLIVGAPNQNPSNKGYVAAYTWSPYTGWGSPQELVYPATAPVNNYYGQSVSLSGNGNLMAIGTRKGNAFSYQYLTFPYFSRSANLNITGDAWVSNVILTQNVFATTINAATLKTTTLTTVGIIDVGPGVSASTFEVQGNVYASDALTTANIFANIYSTNANVRTMNATTVTVTGTANVSQTLNVSTINVLSVSASSLYNVLSGPFTSTLTFSGSNSNEQYGWSDAVSYDGLTLIIGAPNFASSPGSVAIYRYSGGSWNYQSGLTSTATGAQPRFGSAVSLSADGNIALVGAYNAGSGVGYAAVYRFSAGTWGSATTLTGPGSGGFGWSVALSPDGSTAIVGTFSANWAGVYKYNGSVWSSATSLTSPGGNFGYAVGLSYNGNTAIVGAPSVNSAKVFVYSGTWDTGTSLVSTAGAGASFGSGVSLSSDGYTAIVGAGTASSGAGYAAIYKFAGSWGSATQLPYSPVANDGFGYSTSVSSNGDVVAVFAFNTARTNQCYVALFYNVLSGSPSVYRFSFSNIPSSSQHRGGQVSISSSGAVMVFGGPGSGAFAYSIIYQGGVNNIYASNTLSSTDLSVTNTIYYNEDLTRRSLYLTPNATNAPAIQSAISATCNASYKSYWCTSQQPVYANILSVSVTSNAYSGGVYLPDGRVVFVQSNCTNIGIFNPVTTAFTSITGVQPGYNGGVLLPNGNVFFVPQNSNIGIFNPVTSKFSNTGQTLYGQSYNGVLAPEGVWLTPSKYSSSFGASQIALYFPSTNQAVYTIPTEELPKPTSVTAGSFIARGVSLAWSSVIGKFVSIENAGSSYYSSDGTTWTLSTGTTLASIDPACMWIAVAASANKFVATGFNGNYNSAYSTDGINWNAPSSFQNLRIINSTMAWSALAYNSISGGFEALGTGSIFVGTNYAVTPDGITWYAFSSTGTGLPYTSLTCDFIGNPLAVSSANGGAWYYSGGFWSQFPPPGGGLTTLQDLGSIWNSVAYSSTLRIFVAVGSTNGGSSSGSAWVPEPPGAPSWSAASPSLASVGGSSEWTSVSWSPEAGMFIAVGYVSGSTAGIGAYSRDGKSWYTLNPPISSLFGSKYITWSSSLKLWAIISGSGGIAPGSGYVYLAADGYNTGSVLLPSGAIMFSPIGSANVMSFQQTYTSLVSNIVVGTDVFNGMVLAPNGNVITVPSGSNIYVINPTTGTSTNVGPIAGSVTNFFRGGALLPSGNVVFAPGTSANVGMFDPIALTYSNSVAVGTPGISFSGATLLPSGQVVFTPYDSANVGVIDTFAPVSQEFCLSPYFNKF
jgi:hypothetical protein